MLGVLILVWASIYIEDCVLACAIDCVLFLLFFGMSHRFIHWSQDVAIDKDGVIDGESFAIRSLFGFSG